jgi:hypothetical protein
MSASEPELVQEKMNLVARAAKLVWGLRRMEKMTW